MSPDSVQYKTSELGSPSPRGNSLNLDEAQGIVECFVAGVGNKDSVGDIVASGAFTKSLMRRKPRVVWGHSWNDPIGKVLEIYEVPTTDPRLPMKMKIAGIGGLFAKVQFNLNSEKGREAFANVAFFGEEQEWSIGYKTLRSQFDQKTQANIIYELELYEVSPVLHGANQLTGTISIKTDEQNSFIPQVDREEMQKQLSMVHGPKTMLISADNENITFAKPNDNGTLEKFKCCWSRNGSTFMFGAPQRIITPEVSPSSPSAMPMQPSPMMPSHPNRVVIRPQQMPAVPVAIKPNPLGPGTVAVSLPPVQYEGDRKPIDKNNLDKEEADLRDALLKIVKRHGKFNEDSNGVWAGYYPPEKNPVGAIGVKCANCVLYEGGSSCKIISLPVHPEGKCRFAVIPNGVVTAKLGDKSAEDIETEQQEDYLLELEAKYPGELLLAGLRGAIGRFRRKKRRRRFKDLSEFDENEIDEKGYCIAISTDDAFQAKQLLDPIFEYYGAETYVDADGIIIKSGISIDLIEAIDTALLNGEIKKKSLDDGIEVKNLGRRLVSYGASRLIDRPRLGGGRSRGVRGFGVPEGDLNPDTRVDKNRNGWLFDEYPDWRQPDPTPYGPGSIYNRDKTPEQIRDIKKIGRGERISSGRDDDKASLKKAKEIVQSFLDGYEGFDDDDWEYGEEYWKDALNFADEHKDTDYVFSQLEEMADDLAEQNGPGDKNKAEFLRNAREAFDAAGQRRERREAEQSSREEQRRKDRAMFSVEDMTPEEREERISSGRDDKPRRPKQREDRRLSSGRNLARHGKGKNHEQKFGVSRDEKQRRDEFDKVIQNWVDSGMKWNESPRSSSDGDKTESFLRGRELGINQARVAWLGTGRGNGKRSEKFNEKDKKSKEYRDWFLAYSGHLGNFIQALNNQENDKTPDDVKEKHKGIRNGIANEVSAKLPSEDKNSDEIFKWLNKYGFKPQKDETGRLSSGWNLDPDAPKPGERGRTTNIPGLDGGFDPDNPYGDENAPYDVGFDVYDRIIEEFLGDEKLKKDRVEFSEPRKPLTDKEIYERRMNGATLAEMARELMTTREDVRQRELRHMREMRRVAAGGKPIKPKRYRRRANELSKREKANLYSEKMQGASTKKLSKKYGIPPRDVDSIVKETGQRRKRQDDKRIAETRRQKEIEEKAKRDQIEKEKNFDAVRDEGVLSSGRTSSNAANERLNQLGPIGFLNEQLSNKRRERLSSGETSFNREELKKIYDNLSVQILESIKSAMDNPGKQWKRPWANKENYARNITNTQVNPDGRAYEGLNQLILSMTGFAKGYKTNKWAGKQQWEEFGGRVKKGARGTLIKAPTYKNGRKLQNQFHDTLVYNVAEVTGLPKAYYEPAKGNLSEKQRLADIQSVIAEIVPDFKEGNFGGAFYSPDKDMIFMPKFEDFKDAIGFYSTLLHEMTHWTGHSSRLNRKGGRMNAPKDTEDFKRYAFEELIAEIGSSFLMGMLGLEPTFREDHGQYLASWFKLINDDPQAVERALTEAQKAVDYMLNRSSTLRKRLGMEDRERKVDASLREEVPMLEGMEDAPKIPGPGKPKGTFEDTGFDDERLSSGKIEDFVKRPHKVGKLHKIGNRGWSALDRESGDREVYHYSTLMGIIRNGKYYQVSDGWGSVSDKQGIKKILRALGQDAPEPIDAIKTVQRLSSGKIEQFATRPYVSGKVSYAGNNQAWKSIDMPNGDRDIYHYGTRMGFIRDNKFHQVSDGWGSVSDKQGINKILRGLGQSKAIQLPRDGGLELQEERNLLNARTIKTGKNGRVIDSTGRLSSGNESGPIKPSKKGSENNKDLHVKRTDAKISFKAAHRLGFEPTQQQRDIVDLGVSLILGQVGKRILSVSAGAGTGKTSTLKVLARAMQQMFNLDLVDDDVQLNHKLRYLADKFSDDLKEMGIKDLTKIPIDQAKEAVGKLKEKYGEPNLYYGVFNRTNQFEAERAFPEQTTGVSTLDKLAFWGLRLGAADKRFGPHIAKKMQTMRQDLKPAAFINADGTPIRKKSKRTKKKDGTPAVFTVENYITGGRVEIIGEVPVLEDAGLRELSKAEDFIRYFGLRDLFHDSGVQPKGKQKPIPTKKIPQFAQMTVDDLGFFIAKAVENWAYSTDEELSAKHFALTPQQISEKRARRNKKKKRVIKGFKDKTTNVGADDDGSAFEEEAVDPLVDSAFLIEVAQNPEKYIPQEWVDYAAETVSLLQNEFVTDKKGKPIVGKDGKKVLSPVVPDQTQMYKLFAMSKPDLLEGKYMIGHADGLTKKQQVQTAGTIGDYTTGDGTVLKMDKKGKFPAGTDLSDIWVITSLKGQRGKKGNQSAVIQKSFGNPGKKVSAMLIDEAQDLNPVMLQVLEANKDKMPIILVGDARQKVYGFRRAINALAAINPDYILPLNESFRFGSRIAYLANVIQFLGNIDDEEKGIDNFEMQFVSGHLESLVRGQFDDAIELLKKTDRSDEEKSILRNILKTLDEDFGLSSTLGPKKDGFDKNGEMLKIFDDGIPDAQKIKILSDRKDSAIDEAMGEIWDSEMPLLDEKGKPILDDDGDPRPQGELLPQKGRSYAYLTRDNAEIFTAATRLAQHLRTTHLADSLREGQENWEKLSPQIATSAKKHEELIAFFKHAAWILGTDEYKLTYPERRPPASPLFGNIWTKEQVDKRLGQKRYQQMTAMWKLMFTRGEDGKAKFISPKTYIHMLEGHSKAGAGGQMEWREPTIIPERQAIKMSTKWGYMSVAQIREIANRKNAKTSKQKKPQMTSQRQAIPILDLKDVGTIYATLDIAGGDGNSPGKWTGKVIISGHGLSTPRPKVDGKQGRKGGTYREDVKRIMSRDPRFAGKFKYVEKGDTSQRADAVHINDAYILDIKDVGGSEEKLSELIQEAASEIRKAANTNGADAVVTTAQLFKGMEADDVVLGESWQDAFGSIDDELEIQGKISEAFREELNIVYVALTRAKKRIDPGRVLAELYLGTRTTEGEDRRNNAVARLNRYIDELADSKNPEDRKTAEALREPNGFRFPYPEPLDKKDDDDDDKDIEGDPADDELTIEEIIEGGTDISEKEQDELDELNSDGKENDISDEEDGEDEDEDGPIEVGDDDTYDDDQGDTNTIDDQKFGIAELSGEERLSSGKASYWNNQFDDALNSSLADEDNKEVSAYVNSSLAKMRSIFDSLPTIKYAIQNESDADLDNDYAFDVNYEISADVARNISELQENIGKAFNVSWAKERLNNQNVGPKEKSAAKKIISDAQNGRLSSGSGPRRVTTTLEDVQENMKYDWKTAGFDRIPTDEQQLITDAVMTGDDVVVRALAGTGKTTTLEMLAKRLEDQAPSKKIVYLTFTKKMTEEAVKKFAPFRNVEVRTWDSVAYAAIVQPNESLRAKYDAKGSKLPNGKELIYSNAYSDIASHYGLKEFTAQYISKQGNVIEIKVDPYEQGLILSKALNEFSNSAEPKMSTSVIKKMAGIYDISMNDDLAKQLVVVAQKMWDDSFNPESPIQLGRNYVMKKFALTNPDLSSGVGMRKNIMGNDIILFDEAQDANPVMTAIVKNQQIQKIVVGDSNQAIYEFRGAVDELDEFKAKYDLTLTESFRFNQIIAGFANRFLAAHQRKKEGKGKVPKSAKMRLLGRGKNGSVLREESELDGFDPEKPYGPQSVARAVNRQIKPDGKRETFAYLTQTNAPAFKRIIAAQRAGLRTGSVSTFKEDLNNMVDHAQWLMNDKKGTPPAKRYAPFNEYKTWEELRRDVDPKALKKKKSSNNVQAKTAYRLLADEGFRFDTLRNIIDKIETIDEEKINEDTVTVSQVIDKAEFEIIEDGTMVASIDGNKIALNATSKALLPLFMARKPIFAGKHGFRYDKPNERWIRETSSPQEAVEIINDIKKLVRDGMLKDDSGPYSSRTKLVRAVESGSAKGILNEVAINGLDFSFVKSSDGKIRASLSGNTYFHLGGKADQRKKEKIKAGVLRWDKNANNGKGEWYFEADSVDDAVAKIEKIRSNFGLAEGEWVVAPVQKAGSDGGVDIVAQTAHRSKGLEYDYIVLGDDFKTPEKRDEGEVGEDRYWESVGEKGGGTSQDGPGPQTPEEKLDAMSEEDLRLQYVAATRAKKVLVMGSLSWIFDVTDDKDEEYARLSSGKSSRRAARRERLSSGEDDGRIGDIEDPDDEEIMKDLIENDLLPKVPTDEEMEAEYQDLIKRGELDPDDEEIMKDLIENDLLPKVPTDEEMEAEYQDLIKRGKLPSPPSDERISSGRKERRLRRAGGGERLSSGGLPDSATKSRLDGFGGTTEQVNMARQIWRAFGKVGWSLKTSISTSDENQRSSAIKKAMSETGERMKQRGKVTIGSISTNSTQTANPENWMLPIAKLRRAISVPDKNNSTRELNNIELASLLGITDFSSIRKMDREDAAISYNDVMNLIAEIGNTKEFPLWKLFSPTTPDEDGFGGAENSMDRFFENANRSLMRQRFMTEAFGKDAYPRWRKPDGTVISQNDYEKLNDDLDKFKTSGQFPFDGDYEADRPYKDADVDLTFEGYDPETKPIPDAKIKMKDTDNDSVEQKTTKAEFKLQELLEALGIDPNDKKWEEKLQKKISATKKETELVAPGGKTAQRYRSEGVPIAVISELIRIGVIKDAKSVFKSNDAGKRLDYELARRKDVVYETVANLISTKFDGSEFASYTSMETIFGTRDIGTTLNAAEQAKGKRFSKNKGDEPRFGKSDLQNFVNRFNDIFGTKYTIDDIFSDEQLRAARKRIEEDGKVTKLTRFPKLGNRTILKKEED